MGVDHGKCAGRGSQAPQTVSTGTRQGHCGWLRPGVPREVTWRQRDLVVARASGHPYPASTCLVRNLDYDQSMIGSCSGEHPGPVAVESQESEAEQAQREFRGRLILEAVGTRGIAVDTESNVRTRSMYLLSGVCDVRACYPQWWFHRRCSVELLIRHLAKKA